MAHPQPAAAPLERPAPAPGGLPSTGPHPGGDGGVQQLALLLSAGQAADLLPHLPTLQLVSKCSAAMQPAPPAAAAGGGGAALLVLTGAPPQLQNANLLVSRLLQLGL